MSTPKKASKKTATSSHPPYVNMARAAIKELKEPKGSSRQAILKYILAKYKVGTDIKAVNSRLRLALRRGVQNKQLTQKSGSNGRFRLGESATPKASRKRSPSKKAAKKTTTKKSPKKTAKKAAPAATGDSAPAAKKTTPKKKKPAAKKAATKKSPAKKTKKSPAKKAATKKSPKKKTTKKSPKKA